MKSWPAASACASKLSGSERSMRSSGRLRVFLCHASQDKPLVRELYRRLLGEDWIEPWLDEEKLLPGQDWDLEIEKAVEASDAVIVCVSSRSMTKEGYIQKELRKVLDIALEKPEETIFIIPLRLDDCELPRRLRTWHYVDYFPAERREWAFRRLLESLKLRVGQAAPLEKSEMEHDPLPRRAAFVPAPSEPLHNSSVPLVVPAEKSDVDFGGNLLLLAYLLVEAFTYIVDSDAFLDFSKMALAAGIGFILLVRRRLLASTLFRLAFILYLIYHPVVHYLNQLGVEIDITWPILGILALVNAGILVAAIQGPAKTARAASLLIAIYLFLVALEVILQSFGIYGSPIFLLLIILSVITAVVLWREG